MGFRSKVTDAMNSGKVMRFHNIIKRPIELDEDGERKMDEDMIDFLYRGGEFPRHARFKREDGELVEVMDEAVTGFDIDRFVKNCTIHFEDPEDTPVEDRIDWEWIEGEN